MLPKMAIQDCTDAELECRHERAVSGMYMYLLSPNRYKISCRYRLGGDWFKHCHYDRAVPLPADLLQRRDPLGLDCLSELTKCHAVNVVDAVEYFTYGNRVNVTL